MSIGIGIDALAYFVSPSALLYRQKKAPHYKETFVCILDTAETIRQAQKDDRIARNHCYLCRFTGMAWLVWLINFCIVLSGVFLGLYQVFVSKDWTADFCLGVKFHQGFAILGALLVFGGILYFATNFFSSIFDENCKSFLNRGANTPNTAPEGVHSGRLSENA